MKKIITLVAALCLVSSMAFATPPLPLNTVTETAVAAPSFMDGAPAWGNASGGWGVNATGAFGVTSYAQGTKSAEATAIATGTAAGIGGAAGIQTPGFGIGASGAVSTITMGGAGYGIGTDNRVGPWYNPSQTAQNNPDYASVGIKYEGLAGQKNSIEVVNGYGTGAGGGNMTGAAFAGGSSNSSNGKIGPFEDAGLFRIPAIAANADCVGAFAGGYTVAGYVATPGAAVAGAKTVGFSGHTGDTGLAAGIGGVGAQAFAAGQDGSYGVANGLATFGYAGPNSGSGYAQTGNATFVTNGNHSSSVTSISSGSAGSIAK